MALTFKPGFHAQSCSTKQRGRNTNDLTAQHSVTTDLTKMPSLFIMVLADELDPNQITKAFSLQPSQYWRKGEKKSFARKGKKTITFKSKYKWGGWKHHYPSPKSEIALVQKLTAVALKLRKRKTQLHSLVENDHHIFLVSLIQKTSTVCIPPKLHSLLGDLGINLQLDFWA